MKILVSGYHNPYFFTVTEYIEQAVRSLGHDLIACDDRCHLFPGRLRQKFRILQLLSVGHINRRLVRVADCSRPDVAIVTGGHRVTRTTLTRLGQHKIRTALWTTDPPHASDIMPATALYYHYIFCQGTEYVDLFHKLNIKGARWLPMACDTQIHHRVDVSDGEKLRFGSDVAFVGSYYPHRARSLQEVSTFDIGVWGPGWDVLPYDSPLRPFIRAAHTTPEAWTRIYSASKIALSIHYRDPEKRFPVHQASPRVFEAMACGAFVLTDRQKDVMSLFRDGEHLVAFDDDRDLGDKIGYFLQHPEERERIAATGMREVLNKHTYLHRMQNLLSFISGPESAPPQDQFPTVAGKGIE